MGKLVEAKIGGPVDDQTVYLVRDQPTNGPNGVAQTVQNWLSGPERYRTVVRKDRAGAAKAKFDKINGDLWQGTVSLFQDGQLADKKNAYRIRSRW